MQQLELFTRPERFDEDRCETCGDVATQWDYDQYKYFCDQHVEQADFTVPNRPESFAQ